MAVCGNADGYPLSAGTRHKMPAAGCFLHGIRMRAIRIPIFKMEELNN